MAIKFAVEFEVAKNPDDVYDFLTDPYKFASLWPEFHGLTVQDSTHFTLEVNVSIAFITGTAEVKIELAEAQRAQRVGYQGGGNIAGSNVDVIASFDLAPITTGTKVNWQGEAQISGGLASVAGAMLEPLGKKYVQKLMDALQAAMTKQNAAAS
jgi:carbon monoxide dehydrogenase subunit G